MTVRGIATLTCREVVELVSDLFSSEMPPEVRALVEQHLLVCAPCTVHVEQMKTTIELAGWLHAAPEPHPVPEPVLELFRRWQPK